MRMGYKNPLPLVILNEVKNHYPWQGVRARAPPPPCHSERSEESPTLATRMWYNNPLTLVILNAVKNLVLHPDVVQAPPAPGHSECLTNEEMSKIAPMPQPAKAGFALCSPRIYPPGDHAIISLTRYKT